MGLAGDVGKGQGVLYQESGLRAQDEAALQPSRTTTGTDLTLSCALESDEGGKFTLSRFLGVFFFPHFPFAAVVNFRN